MKRVAIQGEPYWCETLDDFLRLIENKLGEDARDYLYEYLYINTEKICNGECDETYRLQEHYERVIRDAVDELEKVKGKTAKMDEIIQCVLKDLHHEI